MKRFITALAAIAMLASASAQEVPLVKGANDPVGEPKGINPGRVAWTHAPGAASWDISAGDDWYSDRWNDQKSADWMVDEAIRTVAGEKCDKKAWNAIFRNFNQTHGNGDKGYTKGEKIAIKVNMNNTGGYEENGEINASPHMALALLRSLVNKAGVPQECITIFDASRYLTDAIYDKCHGEFPNVNYVDNQGGKGRTKTTYTEEAIHYSKESGNMCRGLSNVCIEANYIINMAILKGHVGQGITLCGKNWYGVTSIHRDWRRNAHVNMNQDYNGKPVYITFVDYMGHKDIGGKTMLYLIDALYGCKYVNGKPGPAWNMAPFNGSWPSSLFASQDPVAIDCVGLDFLLAEFPDMPDVRYCDAYLVEAATAGNPASGTFYDPENDGTRLNSLGVCEHWNNASDKKYTKIDLVYRCRKKK